MEGKKEMKGKRRKKREICIKCQLKKVLFDIKLENSKLPLIYGNACSS